MTRAGFDQRRRDTTGRIGEKHGHTRMGIFRKVYGPDFAPGLPDTARLRDVLHTLDVPSLMLLYAHHDDGSLGSRIAEVDR